MADSFSKLKNELRPEARAVLDDEAEQFLRQAVKFARQVQLMDNPWQARRILAGALEWVLEANRQARQEVGAKNKPKQTVEAFRQ